MTPSQIISDAKNALTAKEAYFDASSHYLLYQKPEQYPTEVNNREGVIYYWPKKVEVGSVDGFRLKHGKGFICISETYEYTTASRNRLKKTAHVYRYITDSVTYLCTDMVGGVQDEVLPYSFHYDQDLSYESEDDQDLLRHPPNHLQVLHSHPRFVIEDNMTLQEFIERVKITCFTNDSLDPYLDPIYKISKP